MNLSGISVRELLGKYDLGVKDLLVLWMRRNCLGNDPDSSRRKRGKPQRRESVIGSVGTQEFTRLRLGLRTGHPSEQPQRIRAAADEEGRAGSSGGNDRRSRDAVEMILSQGIDAAMTKYNRRKPADPEEPEEK